MKKTANIGEKVGKQIDKESSNARKSIKELTSILKEIWYTLINSVPKMIRLSVELIKSKKISDRAKFILIGALCVIGFAIAEEFISILTVFSLVAIVIGPISALFALAFIKQLKYLIVAASFFMIVHVFNTMIESEEVEKLSKTLFGEKESDQFMADIQSMYGKLKKFFDPISDKLSSAFEKIGKKKKHIDPETAGDVVIRATKKEMDTLIGWVGNSDADLGEHTI